MNNVLTAKESYELAKWVEEHRNEIECDYRTYKRWAAIAIGDLHFPITEANFSTACKTAGLVWKAKKLKSNGDIQFLAKMLLDIIGVNNLNFYVTDIDRLRNLSHAKNITTDKTLFDGKEL